jgi:FAD binding domain
LNQTSVDCVEFLQSQAAAPSTKQKPLRILPHLTLFLFFKVFSPRITPLNSLPLSIIVPIARWLQELLSLVVDVSNFPAFFESISSNMLAVSGLSAAHTVYLAGGNVVVLDKQGFFGGNSTKATSGINGALTRTQVDAKIPDSVRKFYDDTMKSARDKARPDLIKVLTYKSAAAVEWLQDQFNLDLTLVSRLG